MNLIDSNALEAYLQGSLHLLWWEGLAAMVNISRALGTRCISEFYWLACFHQTLGLTDYFLPSDE